MGGDVSEIDFYLLGSASIMGFQGCKRDLLI